MPWNAGGDWVGRWRSGMSSFRSRSGDGAMAMGSGGGDGRGGGDRAVMQKAVLWVRFDLGLLHVH